MPRIWSHPAQGWMLPDYVGENGSHLEYAMPKSGYVVGGVTDERFVKSDNAAGFKHVFLAAHSEAEEMVREGKSVVLGTWVEEHPDAGERIVIDLCSLYDNGEAVEIPLEIAKKRGERAIYDLKTEREIFVKYRK